MFRNKDEGLAPRDPVLTPPRGSVTLVGAGPGDPDLLTVRALRAIENAEVVVLDHLVGEGVRALIPASAEVIYAGKRSRCHALAQSEINSLLVTLARQGRRVVRLKGGDPFVFGRGGEEAAFLARQGIACSVVPGITSAGGAACACGIPLTHRDYAQSLVLVTGHRSEGHLEPDWSALARPRQTLVIYMGLENAPLIARRLIAHGMSPGMPSAAIERATLPGERIITAPIAALPSEAAKAGLRAPCLILVGEVVSLHPSWVAPRAEGEVAGSVAPQAAVAAL